MTDKIALGLGVVILTGLAVDFHYFGWDATVFLARKLTVLIEWLAFWR
ncbi:hypothetical protein [Roseovarius sp. TE539]|nr:hypothetical protein [Roseovarius sp. TE539]